jgi:hypothetical protein
MTFRTPDGQLDELRFNVLSQKIREAGGGEQEIERVKMCDCDCHTDGQKVMC